MATTSCDPNDLSKSASCLVGCLSGMELDVLIALFCKILTNQQSGAGSQISSGTTDPVNPPANPAIINIYINTVTGVIWQWPPNGPAWQ